MAILKVQHSFMGLSGLPKDQFVNTFHFIGATDTGPTLDPLGEAVKAFYANTFTGSSTSVGSWMGFTSSSPGARIKIYDIADPPHAPPRWDETYTPGAHGASAGNHLPTELAVCLSYSAAFPISVDPKRRRGRIYVGPMGVSALETSTSTDAMVKDTVQNVIKGAALGFAALAVTAGYDWAVYSPTDGAAYSITNVYVDNAWDIQRRRGLKATTRVAGVVA
jgi:hypothetical protein